MNYTTLKDDFKIRFNTNRSIDCAFCGTPLFLLGDITPGTALVTSLSAGTAIAYAPKDTPAFSVQSSDSNISYTCPKDKLLQYHEENYAKNIFHMISSLSPHLPINGADFLFSHNTVSSVFHNQTGALFVLLSDLFSISENDKKILLLKSEPQEQISLISAVNAKSHRAVIYDKSDFKSYPLPISGHKIIIVTADIKNAYLQRKVNDAVKTLGEHLEKSLEVCDISREILTDIPAQQKQLLDFCINERQRISAYPKVASLRELCDLINASSRELLNIIASKELTRLFDIVSSDDICAFRPAFDGTALYCIVQDDSVDKFIFQTEAAYEKKAGFKPAFYVCDTVTNGIIH